MEKIKKCRNCGEIWLYYFGDDVPIENYKNLGWHANCRCGLANISSIWYKDKANVIRDWNSCIFAGEEE